jgi:hypothetical protein
MPDFAPNFTARLRVRYRAALAVHTQTWRYPGVGDGPELNSALTAVGNFYTALGSNMFDDWVVLGCTFATRGSDVFLPTFGIVVAGGVSIPAGNPGIKACAMSAVGRTNAGLRAVVYQYGWGSSISMSSEGNDFRILPGEDTNWDNAYAALVSAGSILCGNDGNAINWYPYANLKANDYWVRKVRQGS